MAYETVLTDLSEGILTATLNRPDRLNAFNLQMSRDLIALADEVDGNDEVRAVVITGAGRGFCAGADLGSAGDSGSGGTFDNQKKERSQHRDQGGLVTLRIFESLKPWISAVNGPAVGVGLTMQLPMDVRLCSDRAKFGLVFARRGIVPEAASSWFLPRVVGISRALEWVETGRVFGPEEALEGGLVSRVVPHDELLSTARALAKEIAENTSSISVALARQMMWKMLGADHPMEAHQVDSAGVYTMGKTPDGYEGVKSFLEKRPAEFPMKVSKDMPEYFPWWTPRKFRGL